MIDDSMLDGFPIGNVFSHLCFWEVQRKLVNDRMNSIQHISKSGRSFSYTFLSADTLTLGLCAADSSFHPHQIHSRSSSK